MKSLSLWLQHKQKLQITKVDKHGHALFKTFLQQFQIKISDN